MLRTCTVCKALCAWPSKELHELCGMPLGYNIATRIQYKRSYEVTVSIKVKYINSITFSNICKKIL